jgi:hypothetical protein
VQELKLKRRKEQRCIFVRGRETRGVHAETEEKIRKLKRMQVGRH